MTTADQNSSQPPPVRENGEVTARLIVVSGCVQGVGFRPFVFRLARRHGVAGSVRNLAGRVLVRVEGSSARLRRFTAELIERAPPLARPVIESVSLATPQNACGFEIDASEAASEPDVHLPADSSLCVDCLVELADPASRRHRHPFMTCTQCGPRYTLIDAMPYDRARTSMAAFDLCESCRREYEDPGDRRFHAEPTCCPSCGPVLTFVREAGEDSRIHGNEPALAAALAALREGAIVAVKGVGGYHLLCDAASEVAVARLRQRKRRPSKPLAVMVPAAGRDGLDVARRCVELEPVAASTLLHPARSIVLAPRRVDCALAAGIAPGLREIGVFLPYSPLHALIAADFGGALVATSGNLSGEPVVTNWADAERRLGEIADAFLHHDRPIRRPADDPVVRVIAQTPRAIRLGRGTAPLEMALEMALPEPLLAVGGQGKATIAIGFAQRAVISPHIGDLESPRALDLLAQLSADLPRLYGVLPRRIVIDTHPGYLSARWAQRQALPVVPIQHHVAHASALAGEYRDVRRWLVFAWDGSGYGADGALWGGEALLGYPGSWQRVASFRPFRLPGGEAASRAPWRSAAAAMWECGREFAAPLAADAARMLRRAWDGGLNAPATSAVGRLFDAAAMLVSGIAETSYEGEAAMRLEALAQEASRAAIAPIQLPLASDATGLLRTDWEPLLDALTDQMLSPARRGRLFHISLAEALITQVIAIRAATSTRSDILPFEAVGLTGGVFQNKLLAENVCRRLGYLGIDVRMPSLVPANDGGLAFGQIVEAAALLQGEADHVR